MAIATYTLGVNSDGSQNTGFPAGDKGSALVTPDSLTAVAASTSAIDLNWNYNSSGHTEFEIGQWIGGTSTSWDIVATVGPTARYYQATSLPSGTHIGHRIRASDGAGVVSSWSYEAWTDTISAGAASPIFSDSFASATLGQTIANRVPDIAAAGVKWASANADHDEDRPIIVSGGYGGDAQALGFRFNPRLNAASEPYAYSEQRYNLCNSASTAIWEIWAEYYVYWPNEYVLNTIANKPNNKCFDLLSTQFGQIVSTHYGGDYWSDSECWPKSDKSRMVLSQNVSMGRNGSRQNWGHSTQDWATPPYSSNNFQGSNPFNPVDTGPNSLAFWDENVDNGNWRRYRFHCRPSTSSGQYTALFECWKDNTKIVEIKDSDFADDTVQGFDSGYIFGWLNTGVVESCVVKVSRFNMWKDDPQWSFN